MSTAVSKTPIELWELILCSAIDLNGLFDNTCTHETYLEFRGIAPTYLDAFNESEQLRKRIGAVCRAWRDFAQRHDHRWINLWERQSPSPFPENDHIRNAIRVDVGSRNHQNFLKATQERDSDGSCCGNRISILTMDLQHLDRNIAMEMTFPYIRGNPFIYHHVTFLQLVFRRDYSVIPSSQVFGTLSVSCPNLIGLDVGPLMVMRMDQPLRFQHLEVLTLRPEPHPGSHAADLFWELPESNRSIPWETPRLRHFAIAGTKNMSIGEYIYMKTMLPRLESLHLELYEPFVLPKSFWKDFQDLKLLFADWGLIRLDEAGWPSQGHPLEILVQQAHPRAFANLLEGWRDYLEGEQTGNLKTVFVQCRRDSLSLDPAASKEFSVLEEICQRSGIKMELGYEELI